MSRLHGRTKPIADTCLPSWVECPSAPSWLILLDHCHRHQSNAYAIGSWTANSAQYRYRRQSQVISIFLRKYLVQIKKDWILRRNLTSSVYELKTRLSNQIHGPIPYTRRDEINCSSMFGYVIWTHIASFFSRRVRENRPGLFDVLKERNGSLRWRSSLHTTCHKWTSWAEVLLPSEPYIWVDISTLDSILLLIEMYNDISSMTQGELN